MVTVVACTVHSQSRGRLRPPPSNMVRVSIPDEWPWTARRTRDQGMNAVLRGRSGNRPSSLHESAEVPMSLSTNTLNSAPRGSPLSAPTKTLIKAVDDDRGTTPGEGMKAWRMFLKSTIAVDASDLIVKTDLPTSRPRPRRAQGPEDGKLQRGAHVPDRQGRPQQRPMGLLPQPRLGRLRLRLRRQPTFPREPLHGSRQAGHRRPTDHRRRHAVRGPVSSRHHSAKSP